MSRNLNHEEKGRIKDRYSNHLFYRLANLSCKRFESQMKSFRFSPEDVFVEALNVLDDLKEPQANLDDACNTMWDDLYCRFRDRGEDLPEEEVNLAVCIVMSMVVMCLTGSKVMRYSGKIGGLIMLQSQHYPSVMAIQGHIEFFVHRIGINNFCQWAKEYMTCDAYLSEEVEDCLKGEEDMAVKSSRVFLSAKQGSKIDFIRVVNVLYELGLFQNEQGGSITKKEVFTTLGRFVNVDLSKYDKDLSRSLTDSTALDKHLKIFNLMKEKMEEIFNSK
ncbi:MAG: hypothetical protein IKK67_00850 [Bacteroidaceae bacterium]|nr:hypothetical protein [Bacteroidaceae bacterium]